MSQNFSEARAILQKVFGSDEEITPTNSHSQNQYLIIKSQKGLRWIIPKKAFLGYKVLSEWQPYGLISILKWKTLFRLYSIGILDKLTGVETISCIFDNTLTVPDMDGRFVPVVYVGASGPHQKAVVSLVDPKNGTPCMIMKIAIGCHAEIGMIRESSILQRLCNQAIIEAPYFHSISEQGKRTWQTVVSGRPSSRRMTDSHIDWLLKLPKTGFTTFNLERDRISEQLLTAYHSKIGEFVITAMKKISNNEAFPLVFTHGDFAPWNIKKKKDSSIAVVDWEDASDKGLPLIDVCHFFLIQALLFRDKHPIYKLAANGLIKRYMKGLGIDPKLIGRLVIVCLLSMIAKTEGNISDDYKKFLMYQIPEALRL